MARNRHTWMRVLVVVAAALAAPVPPVHAAEAFIGGLRNVTGEARVARGERVVRARSGMRVFVGDLLQTGDDATLQVVFRDGSEMVVDGGSEVRLAEYVFEPATREYGMLTEVARGAALFVTGTLGKLAPERVSVKTPVSTIGIRGTRFIVRVAN